MNINVVAWAIYFGFVAVVFVAGWHEQVLEFSGPGGLLKALFWAVYLAFLLFSIYCTTKENFFRSFNSVLSLLWGRQVTADLYIGLLFAATLIYINEGSMLILALWLLPVILFANLATLPYLLVNFEELAMRLAG